MEVARPRHWWLGEFGTAAALLVIVLGSGAIRVQLGVGTLPGALVSSLALGLGFGLVTWTFGPISGAQESPTISIAASTLGGQSWVETRARILAQAGGVTAACLTAGFLASTAIAPGLASRAAT